MVIPRGFFYGDLKLESEENEGVILLTRSNRTTSLIETRTMNYKIVNDEKRLIDFIDWLPELADNEKFYCALLSRKKYAEVWNTKSDKSHLKRFLTDKEKMLNKIRQLEVKVGEYKLFGTEVDEKSLALYINPNPRDLHKATYNGIIEFTKLLRDENKSYNPHAEILSCIQRSVGNKVYLDFDIDYKPFDVATLDPFINREAITILETRGGYHILVELKKIEPEYKSKFYQGIKSLNVDQTGDQLIPIPGCIQGGFVPRFLN